MSDNNEFEIESFLKTLSNMREKDFLLELSKKMKADNKFEHVFYLLRIFSDIESEWYWENLILDINEFLKYMMKEGKVSNQYFKKMYNSKEPVDEESFYEDITNSFDLLNEEKFFGDESIYFNSLNYLWALYIFNTPKELNYFYNTFVPDRIANYNHESSYMLIETNQSYEIDLKNFENIKIYDITDDMNILEQINLQNKEDLSSLEIKCKSEKFEDLCDFLIEVETDVDKIKDSIKDLKESLKDIFENLNNNNLY